MYGRRILDVFWPRCWPRDETAACGLESAPPASYKLDKDVQIRNAQRCQALVPGQPRDDAPRPAGGRGDDAVPHGCLR